MAAAGSFHVSAYLQYHCHATAPTAELLLSNYMYFNLRILL